MGLETKNGRYVVGKEQKPKKSHKVSKIRAKKRNVRYLYSHSIDSIHRKKKKTAVA